ncbi:TetR/AcrR family transcriptional regulator [Actinotalea sp. K2]|uniref:TetR/AcrR family transcriptional regulator n=1 Tax=Actinotalea sp. K2 TaxID=2939438 RepID=UPI002016EF45|nr:TetR/AcrR family transcriptional regulator [Actinotalea sp. K2]MCL3859862.1 TetR/AcrR family transcriptional regulator [Actinotalea sp. K2]
MTPESSSRPRAARMPRDERRAQVLTVAQELFAHEGFHHVSMDDIADRAEVSKPVLYRHFPSKLDLYLAVVDHRGLALVAAVDAALAAVPVPGTQPPTDTAPSGREVVRAIVRAYVEFVEEAGESFSLLFESDVTRDADVRARIELASADAARAICRGLHELAGLPPAHAELLSAALVGMARVSATARYRSSEPVPVDDTVELVSRLAWRGVAGLVRDRPESTEDGTPA